MIKLETEREQQLCREINELEMKKRELTSELSEIDRDKRRKLLSSYVGMAFFMPEPYTADPNDKFYCLLLNILPNGHGFEYIKVKSTNKIKSISFGTTFTDGMDFRKKENRISKEQFNDVFQNTLDTISLNMKMGHNR